MSSSRTKAVRSVVAVVAAAALAVAVTACGNDVPTGAVAKIGDTVVAKKDFNKLYASTAKGAEEQLGAVPDQSDAPNFTACVAEAKKQQPQGQGASDADLRKQCRDAYDQVKQQVMQFLIQSQWVVQEAEEQGVTVSDSEVVEKFQQQKKEAFPKEKDYRNFLRESGTDEGSILFQIKVQTLQEKLTEKIQADQEDVSDEDVEEYYEENKENFGQPERRDLQVILTKTEAKANAAKEELDGGAKFPAVVKKYSIDQASKANGGKLPDVPKGQQEQAFDEAIFSAEPGQVEGPVRTQFGWYLFRVTDVTPASQQSLENAKETIRNLLKSENGQKGLQDFIKEFQEDFTDKTVCAEGYLVPICSNDPSGRTDTGPASGGSPDGPQAAPGAPGAAPPGAQGAPPQAAPPQAAPQQAPPQQAPPTAP